MTWRGEGDKECVSTGRKIPQGTKWRNSEVNVKKKAQDSAGRPNQCLAPELQNAKIPLS